MNIFVLDKDPVLAAQYQCDKHVVKMVLETAQMLCTVLGNLGETTPYKATHPNHPCTKWAAESRQNFEWLVLHGIALAEEYSLRYGRTHKSESAIRYAAPLAHLLPGTGLTPWTQAMPEQYKGPCAVQAYRKYYLGEKKHFAVWGICTPYWAEEEAWDTT